MRTLGTIWRWLVRFLGVLRSVFLRFVMNSHKRRPDRQDRDGESGTSSRREFLAKGAVAFAGLAALVASVPGLGVLFSPVIRREEDVWRAVGQLDEFPIGETIQVVYRGPDPLPWAGIAAENAAWLRRESEARFTAFSVYCTHTGCPVAWAPGADLFICPCHGGVFNESGAVVAGPPREPLPRLPVRIQEDGQVEIGTAPIPVAE